MRRREFITLVGGGSLAARSAGAAVGDAGSPTSPEANAERLRGFRQGLKDTGYVEGENVAIEYRWAEDHSDRLPALAADLVRRRVGVIATTQSIPAALAAN